MNKIYGDRWEIIESLSEGGQANTFLVNDLHDNGKIKYVLKRLKSRKRIDRFEREIKATKKLSHENIVRLIDYDLSSKKPFLVTEFCAGGSLSNVKPYWKESLPKAFEIFEQICEGVIYAHNNDVIHRDLKPDNIFLRSESGPAVVGDFGICFVETGGARLTLLDEAVGPTSFIAPELEDGRSKVSTKCDTYSLGKILYWLLSGGKIFSREKHRDKKFDLKEFNEDTQLGLGWNNIYMEHVNRLLDFMIIENPDKRQDVDIIRILFKTTRRLLEKEFTPISPDIKQPCVYCGQGYYLERDGNNFGFQTHRSPNWRVFGCNKCGHTQLFRVDLAEKKEWWEKSEE